MNKISPKPIRIFFVPMIALAVTVPVTLLFLGPLGYNVGQIFTAAILFLYDKLGFVALTVLSAILPLMVATGIDVYKRQGVERGSDRDRYGHGAHPQHP